MNTGRFFTFGLLFVSLGGVVFAQPTLYLKPLVGVQIPTCHIQANSNATTASTFQVNNFGLRHLSFTDNYGLLLQLKLNETWSISSGYSRGNIGWSYSIKLPRNVRKSGGWAEAASGSSIYIERFPILAQFVIKDVHLFRLTNDEAVLRRINVDDENILYLLLFQLKGLFGVSYDHIFPLYNFGGSLSIQPPAGGNSIERTDSTIVRRTNNVSFVAGVSLQFRHRNKDRLELNVYYSQGVVRMMDADVTYRINGQGFFSKLGSRGSFLGVNLAYPIRLKTWRKKQ